MSGFFSFLAFLAFAAFIVGMIRPKLMVFWTNRKTRGMASLYLAAMVVFVIISSSTAGKAPPSAASSIPPAISSQTASTPPVSPGASPAPAAPVSSFPASSANALKTYSADLLSGFYTSGIDFPPGTYNLTALKGNGNVITDDGTLNTIMGTSKGDMYEKEYKNAEFKDGTVLSVSGVSIRIVSKNPVDAATLKKRENTATKTYTFSSGNYIAGEDVEAGIYDLSAVKGNGNVSTDDGILNTIMGTNNDVMYQKKYLHVPLKKGTKLTISGVTVKLEPSK